MTTKEFYRRRAELDGRDADAAAWVLVFACLFGSVSAFYFLLSAL